MALNEETINDVTFNISGAISAAEAAVDKIEDCGLNEYDYNIVKDGLLKTLQVLDIVYDIMCLAEEKEIRL